jgi:hypothetical protein
LHQGLQTGKKRGVVETVVLEDAGFVKPVDAALIEIDSVGVELEVVTFVVFVAFEAVEAAGIVAGELSSNWGY